jgi:hypothetical protein
LINVQHHYRKPLHHLSEVAEVEDLLVVVQVVTFNF